MEAEETQEYGREGVFLIKRWLESTTYLELNWIVYHKPAFCTLQLLNGQKKFDLAGQFIGENQRPVSVECKRASSDSKLGKAFRRFLAEAYSNTLYHIGHGGDLEREFIWATTHPFAVKTWSKLHSPDAIKQALLANPDVLSKSYTDSTFDATAHIDEDWVRKVSKRIWLLVMSEKQDALSLSTEEVLDVWKVLRRKEIR